MAASKPSPKKLNIPKLADKYLKFMENVESASPLTLKSYRLDLAQAFPGIWGDEKGSSPLPSWEDWSAMTEPDLLSAARKAQLAWADLSSASRNRKAATLKSFYGYLFRENHLVMNLADQIHSPKVGKKIPHFLSVDEVVSVLQNFDEEKNGNPQEKLLFLLLYGAGLRVSEACSLRWSQVDVKSQVLRIKGKGNKERLVAFPKSLAPLFLKAQKSQKKGDTIWGERALSPRKAYDWVRSRGAKAGLLRPIHPHALRHSFATHLLASGANLRTLQELLGHESLQATEKYTHLGVDQLARTLEKHHPLAKK